MGNEKLEKIFEKEKGYYDSYDEWEDLICDVCGKIIHNDDWTKGQEEEQEFTDKGEQITFCSECKILPNKNELIKIYESGEEDG